MKRVTKTAVRKHMDAWTMLAKSAAGELTPGEKAALEASAWKVGRKRGRPRMLEAADQERLTIEAARCWWWLGYRHHMPERASKREAWQGADRGVKPGWPDVTLHVPLRPGYMPVRAALELKSTSNTSSGTEAQLRTLRQLELCGYAVHVAHGWEDALAWLNAQAGPKPIEPPEGWREMLDDGEW